MQSMTLTLPPGSYSSAFSRY